MTAGEAIRLRIPLQVGINGRLLVMNAKKKTTYLVTVLNDGFQFRLAWFATTTCHSNLIPDLRKRSDRCKHNVKPNKLIDSVLKTMLRAHGRKGHTYSTVKRSFQNPIYLRYRMRDLVFLFQVSAGVRNYNGTHSACYVTRD